MTRAVTATGAELSARSAAKVVCTLGCHFWVGGFADDGYGRFAVGGGRVVRAHRWAWVQAYGPVPDGLMVMHGCDETSCVNAVECLLLGDQAGTWSRWPIAPDRRRAAARARAIREALCGGYDPAGWRPRSRRVTPGLGSACCSSRRKRRAAVHGPGGRGWDGC